MMTCTLPRMSFVERSHCLPLHPLRPIRFAARPYRSSLRVRSKGMDRLNELLEKNKCSYHRGLRIEASRPYRFAFQDLARGQEGRKRRVLHALRKSPIS